MKNELLTVEQTRAADAATLKGGVPENILMERAGARVVEVVLKHFPPCSTVVFCGPGKNGGDGQVVARHLREQGWPVEVVELQDLPSFEKVQSSVKRADLVIDALFGTGLVRPLEGDAFKLVALINDSHKPVVSVDIPSGIDTNSGASLGVAIQATHTVTFFRAHPGHFLLPGRVCSGKLHVKDIGILDKFLPPNPFSLNTPSLWGRHINFPQPIDHKYSRGACLIVGSGSMPGALKLAALAARRAGAGLVRLTCKAEDYPILATNVWGDIITPLSTAQDFLNWTTDDRFRALLWGTGAMPTQSTREQALLVLGAKKPCVLDGGALSSFKEKMSELISAVHQNVILTPHGGEFACLFPHLAFLKNKPEKALKAAEEVGAIVVLKGYDTVIASPSGQLVINANAPATLATAGTGDVLAGIMVGLLAQGLPPFQAACAAVWIHGEAASRVGLGLIAEDLSGEIPSVLQFLQLLLAAKA